MGASGLGALLVKEGFLTEQDRLTITKTCGQGSWAFAKCILSAGLLDEDELAAFFAERTRHVIAPKNLLDRLDASVFEQIDRRMISRLEILPLEVDHQKITVAVADPLDRGTIKQLEFFSGLEVITVIAPLSQIHEGLTRLNPDFKPRYTALSNFIRNHAGTAWIKQKVIEDDDLDVPAKPTKAKKPAPVDDFSSDDDDIEVVDFDENDTEQSDDEVDENENYELNEDMADSDFDDIEVVEKSSRFASNSDPDFDALESNADSDSDLDLDAPESNVDSELEASDSNELLDDFGLGDEELRPLSSSEEKNSSHYPAGKDEDIEASSLNANERSQSLSALDDAFDIDDEEREAPALNEQDSTDLFSALDDGTFESDDESTQELSGDIPAAKAPKAKHDADELFANIENDNDIDDIETNTSSMQDSEDEQSFSSFEETNINLLAKADLETKKEFGEEFDFDSSEETKISLHLQTDKPDEKESNRTNDNTPHKQDSELPLNQIDKLMEPSFDPLLGASDLNLSDEPIFVEESTNSAADTPIRLEAIERNGGSASLTATAKANEALLRLSLCFDRTSALNIAREYLPQISSNGCLIQLGKTAEAIANWRRGAHTENKAKPSRELQTIAKTAKHGEWSKIPVAMQKEFFDTKQSLVIYKHQKSDGSILLLAGDYPAEDETLREVLSSFAQQLGQK